MNRGRILLFVLLALMSSLACRAATRLILADTPTPLPPTPTSLPSTPTSVASCPDEAPSILEAANQPSYVYGNFPNVDTGNNLDIQLVTYTVNGDQIIDPVMEPVPNNLKKYRSDLSTQEKAWKLFADLIPADRRQIIAEYQVMTDGPGDVLAIVEQTRSDPQKWILEVDIADLQDTKNLVFTFLHELGHLLTLNSSQVPPDLEVFNHPDNEKVFDREAAACPFYFPGEGCSLPFSYLNTFVNKFWTGLYDEWHQIDIIQDDNKRQDKLDAFYQKYKDQFVDDYAVTDPNEDIAESWAYFVLSPKPQENTVADKKLLFFYQYPELNQLRDQILQNLCTVHP
jgi:hypothetical protein